MNHLSQAGITILNSTLISPEETRQCLKPVSHTGDLQFSGRPWEILRIPQSDNGRIVDLYTKAGDLLQHNSCLILITNHKCEFIMLVAITSGKVPSTNSFTADTLTSTMIRPGLLGIGRNSSKICRPL